MANVIYIHGIGLFLIIAYSIRFFNQPLYNYSESNTRYKDFVLPVEPRLMTEYHAYRFFRFIFICLLVFIYFVLFYILSTIPPGDVDSSLKIVAKTLGENHFIASIVSVLAIIGVTQYPKWLSSLISDLREILHEQARIPLKGHELFDDLLHVRIDYTKPTAKRVIDNILNNNPVSTTMKRLDIEEKDFALDNRKSVMWKWAKLSYLLECLNETSLQKNGRRFEIEHRLGFRNLQHEYIELIDDVSEYKMNGDSWEKAEVDELRENVRKLLYQTCRLIACLLILTADPEVDPCVWLKKYAYEVEVDNRIRLKGVSVLITFLVLISVITVFMFVVGHLFEFFSKASPDITAMKLLTYNVYAAIMMVLPLLYVVYVKQRLSIIGTWPSVLTKEDEYTFTQRPWLIYFGLGFIGWLITNVLASIFSYVMAGSAQHGLGFEQVFYTKMSNLMPFTFIAFITIVLSCYRLDSLPIHFKMGKIKPYLRYLVQGLIQGTLIFLVIVFGLYSLKNGASAKVKDFVWFYGFLGFAAGFCTSIAFQFSNNSYVEIKK